jgi:hypothetical protein
MLAKKTCSHTKKSGVYNFIRGSVGAESINIVPEKIQRATSKELCERINVLKNLRVVYLKEYAGEENVADMLRHMNKVTCFNIIHAHLYYSYPFKIEGYIPNFAYFACSIGHMESLQCLSITNTVLDEKHLSLLANSVTNMPHLRRITMSEDSMYDEAACSLGEILKKVKTLTHIDISKNKIRDVGARAIAKAVGELTRLNYFDFGGNLYDEDSTDVLFCSILMSPFLESFSINHLFPHVSSMHAIKRRYKKLCTLEKFRSRENMCMRFFLLVCKKVINVKAILEKKKKMFIVAENIYSFRD